MNREHKARTLAFQLAQILSVYSSSFELWRQDPSDVGRYERMHANLDLVRVLTDKTFTGGCVELAPLLIAHADLKLLVLRRHILRGAPDIDSSDARLQDFQVRHDDAVSALRSVCLQRSSPDTVDMM